MFVDVVGYSYVQQVQNDVFDVDLVDELCVVVELWVVFLELFECDVRYEFVFVL